MNRLDGEELATPAGMEDRLDSIEAMVLQIRELLLQRRPEKQWYTVAEVAKLLNRRPFTIREWCRLGRIYASKRDAGRGPSREWMIAREELERIENEGLLPL